MEPADGESSGVSIGHWVEAVIFVVGVAALMTMATLL